jgi:tripartite-type tricarboxylate transporter receptor subunit TctC
MKQIPFRRVSAAIVLAAIVSPGGHAFAQQQYPVKPIRLIVPNAPGGGSDTIARLVADTLSTNLGQQVIVDNRAGAGGRIGAELAMRSPPDGYTLLLGTGSLMITAPALYSDLPYDPNRDFSPVSMAATTSYLLCSHPSIPARSVGELVRSAKSHRTGLNYGSTGPGTFSHLGGELLKSMGGINATHIAFKGSAQSTMSLVQGEIDIMFNNFIAAMPLVRANRLRAIGVTSLKRSSLVPEIPTIHESGLKGFEMQQIYSVWAPAGLSADVVRRLNSELVRGLAKSDGGQKLAADGTEISTSTPAELSKFVATQISFWSRIVKSAGIKGD